MNKQYRIVSGSINQGTSVKDTQYFEEHCNRVLTVGFAPVGGVAISVSPDGLVMMVVQAFVRKE